MKMTLILAAAGVALSATAVQAETRTVTYDDLNLATTAGQTALTQRVERAARDVCELQRGGHRNLRQQMAARRCFEATKANVGAQVAARIEDKALGG